MKSALVYSLAALCAFSPLASGADVLIEPLPPVGSEISVSKEGVVQVHMDKPGTVILGHCKVEAVPENYIIIFTAEGMASELSGGDISLVIFAAEGKGVARRAHSGTVLTSARPDWSGMKTSFLAKATKQYDQIILGMDCEGACNVQLRNFKVQAMSRLDYDKQVEARRKKADQTKE